MQHYALYYALLQRAPVSCCGC